LATQAGKVGLSGQIGHTSQTNPTNSLSFFREDKIPGTKLLQTGENNNHNKLGYAGAELSFILSKQDFLTAAYVHNKSKGSSYFIQQSELLKTNGEIMEAYQHLNLTDNSSSGTDLNLDYQHNFKRNTEHLLTIAYKVSHSDAVAMTNFSLIPLLNYKEKIARTTNGDGIRERTVQVDYIHPIKKQTLELGVKSIFRRNSSDYYNENLDSVVRIFILDSSQSNTYDYQEHINAAYVALNLNAGNWGIKAGARLEETKVEASFKTSGTAALQDYNNIIPSFNLYRRLKGTSMVKLSYTQRIERPGLYYLDPYVDATDPRNISYGNPGLRPANTHVFSLTYNASIKRSYLRFDITHYFTNNSIQQITVLGTDTIARTSFGNTGRNKTTSFSLNGNINLSKKSSVILNSTTNFLTYSGSINGELRNRDGCVYNLSGTFTYHAKGWRLNSTIGYSSAAISLQGKAGGNTWSNASVNRVFLKNNKASIGLSVKSLFQKNRTSFNETSDPAFYQMRQTYVPVRYYTISLNFNFGKVHSGRASQK
jgi:hypothetical protein